MAATTGIDHKGTHQTYQTNHSPVSLFQPLNSSLSFASLAKFTKCTIFIGNYISVTFITSITLYTSMPFTYSLNIVYFTLIYIFIIYGFTIIFSIYTFDIIHFACTPFTHLVSSAFAYSACIHLTSVEFIYSSPHHIDEHLIRFSKLSYLVHIWYRINACHFQIYLF